MQTIGVIGLGNMGIGMARNLVATGFPTVGFDVRRDRCSLLENAGGKAAENAAAVGAQSDIVFVMVLTGTQVRDVLLGPAGALEGLLPGSTVIVTATIHPEEVRSLEAPLAERGIRLIDSPVTGGKAGADGGTLTLIAAAPTDILEASWNAMEAVSRTVFHVGEQIGQGQATKAALQALIGCTFAATFESLVLGVKAGVPGRTLFEVFRASAAGSPLIEHCARQVLDRRFRNTGSGIGTMFKDLGVSMGLARESGTLMLTTSAAYEMFQAGISRFPDEDNWAVAKWLEEIAGTEVSW